MNLTSVLLPTTVTLAVLLTVKITGATSTVSLSPIRVLFSLDVMFTVLFHVPTAIDFATIQ